MLAKSVSSSHWTFKGFSDGVQIRWLATAISSEVANRIRNSIHSANAIDQLVGYSADVWEVIYPTSKLPDDEPATATLPNPSARQVGGNHYKTLAVEPWKAMESWLTREEYIGFLRGNIIKYHARANSGKEDKDIQLAKAKHYADELESFLSRCKPIPE